MNYEESVRALMALGRELAAPQQARVQKFALDNITTLAAALGDPHRSIPCVHIAGTNGKGSTAAMLESILRAAGLRTGLYTSPHLERINERIRIDGESVSDEVFAAAWTRVHATIESLMAAGKLAAHPTFFECVTAMAFLAFAESRVDLAIYEVGLGGRLDATNIIFPEVAIITPVDFDHESYLGHSIEEIAFEKAGIIKKDGCVVSSVSREEARAVIARRAQEMNARMIESDSTWRLENVTRSDGHYRAVAVSVKTKARLAIAPGLPGHFQLRNALAAATAAEILAARGYAVANIAIEQGIARARWPGRLERLARHPDIYLDGAHNPSAARELREFWDEEFANRDIYLVYGAMRDKAVDEIAGILFPRTKAVFLTQPQQPRAISANLLAEMTHGLAPDIYVVRDPTEALERAIQMAGPNDAVFVSGSLYLVGELTSYWKSHRRK
ncbi:MAG: folylpolyglutamate synthase/dihydrofolate synthase family protein [Candidatus Acidiferrales bacterium]